MEKLIFGVIFIFLISQKCICQENKLLDSAIKIVDTSISKFREEDIIFTKCEKLAEFNGGTKKWLKYLKNNLNIQVPIINRAPKGNYNVIIKFIVNSDGTIRDLTAESNQGYGMEEEVIRVIKNGPNWIPASHSGRNVNSYRRQPVTFSIN